MPLNIPNNRQEVVNRSKADVQAELEGSDPFLPNSFLSAIVIANALRLYELYIQLDNAVEETFWDTATGIYLQRWGLLRGVTRNTSSPSIGAITATGSNNTPIPLGATLTSASGIQIKTMENDVVTNHVLLISLTSDGFTATATTPSPHQLATSTVVTITGALETPYNITTRIIVISATQFIYQLQSTTSSPATGFPEVQVSFASINVNSSGFGSNNNVPAGTAFTFNSNIGGLDNIAYVQFGGLTGGANVESDRDYLVRIQEAWSDPNTPFNVAEITRLAKTTPGVTRVFIFSPETPTPPGYPEPGQVKIYFTRDNDENIIPSGQDVSNMKELILTIKPAHTDDADVMVFSPVAKVVDFVFTTLDPNTLSMQQAISATLKEVFTESTSVGVSLNEIFYTAPISQTIDTQTGNTVNTFSLSSPVGGVPVSFGEIPVLGNINFPG